LHGALANSTGKISFGRDLFLFGHGPVTEEKIIKVTIVNFTPLVTESLLTHRLINLNVCLPEIVVLLIWLIQYFKQIHQSLDNFRTGGNSNLESCKGIVPPLRISSGSEIFMVIGDLDPSQER